MAIAKHSTAADGSFSTAGAQAWDDDHVVTLGADENFVTDTEKAILVSGGPQGPQGNQGAGSQGPQGNQGAQGVAGGGGGSSNPNAGIDGEPTITEGTGGDAGKLQIATTTAWFCTDATKETLASHTITASGYLTLTDDVTCYICADRDTDTWVILTNYDDIDFVRYLPYVVAIKRAGSTNLHHQIDELQAHGAIEAIYHRFFHTNKYGHESGMESISVDASLNITVDAGIMWVVFRPYSIPAVTAATRQFKCHRNGTVTSNTSPMVINDYYDAGSGFVALPGGAWVINWLYRGIEEQDHIYTLLSDQLTSPDDANIISEPVIYPEIISSHAVLIGKIVVESGQGVDPTHIYSLLNNTASNSGAVGPQGAQGNQGSQGADGSNGNQGSQGNQGNQGDASTVAGPQGNQGSQGTTGSGSQGNQGNQGSAGSNGNQGNQGNQGTTGSGTQGNQGNQGNNGSNGNQGNQGNQGLTGSGNQGNQGNQGSAGTGTQGNQGNQGAAGSGAQGNQGNQGNAGTNGNQGNQGNQGQTGSGNQGNQGAAGSNGNQGNQGAAGAGLSTLYSVQGSQVTCAAATVTDVFAPISVTTSTTYRFYATIGLQPAAGTQGCQVGIQCSVAGATVEGKVSGPQTTTADKSYRQTAQGVGVLPMQNIAGAQSVSLEGIIITPGTGSPTIGVQVKGIQASQAWYAKANCYLRLEKTA